MAERLAEAVPILWKDIPAASRADLTGRLSGLWGAVSDEAAFNSFAVDKQQALLIILNRLREKRLWQVIRRIENVYGEGGVGMQFSAWPIILSTLNGRKDFTRILANHKDTTRGYYERGRSEAVLHFLYVAGQPQKWYVHFDLYSPVYSLVSLLKHVRYEFVGKLTPDWRMIQKLLRARSVQQ